MIKLKKNLGFSIIEMTLSTFMVISVSMVAYRVLKTQTEQQVTSIKNQKNNRTSQVALNRFKSDVDQFDPNWVRYGIAAVYPHQGYGLGNNYYLMSSADRAKTNLNDGVTFYDEV
jgi:Tfp pilus assembly protein PilV